MNKIELIDHMGSDLTVVNAARVSMAKAHDEFDSLSDTKLIKYLAKNNHWTPFSQPQIQFRIRMPIFVARQWLKHQIGFTRNETSRRYVSDTPEFYTPDEWRGRPDDNIKQGSSEKIITNSVISTCYENLIKEALATYEYMLKEGVAPEMARMVLPQSMMTEFIETGSLAAYARLIKLREGEHAQKEIKEYATTIKNKLIPLFPVSLEALL